MILNSRYVNNLMNSTAMLNFSVPKNLYKKKISQVKDKELRSVLLAYNKFHRKKNAFSQVSLMQMNDVIYKFEICKDSKIKNIVRNLLLCIKVLPETEWNSIMEKAEHLLDCVNVANKEYCTLYNKKGLMGEMVNTISDLSDITKEKFLENPKDKEEWNLFKEKLFYPESRSIWRYKTRNNITMPLAEIENNCKHEEIVEYISQNPNDTDINKYLWTKYYLNRLDISVHKLANQILDEFGTFVLGFISPDKVDLRYVFEELKNWKEICKDKLIAPLVLNIRKTHKIISGNCAGYCMKELRKIVVNEIDANTTRIGYNILRHELAHLNNTKENKLLSEKHKNLLKNEFKKGQISDYHIEYGLLDTHEAASVGSEGDVSKYSKNGKNLLVKCGLPEKFENLRPTHYYILDLLTYIDNKTSKKIIKRIDELTNGNISFNFVCMLEECPEHINHLKKILKDFKNRDSAAEKEILVYYKQRLNLALQKINSQISQLDKNENSKKIKTLERRADSIKSMIKCWLGE